jgi:hypothetical protein
MFANAAQGTGLVDRLRLKRTVLLGNTCDSHPDATIKHREDFWNALDRHNNSIPENP